jgi:hypothetical protein
MKKQKINVFVIIGIQTYDLQNHRSSSPAPEITVLALFLTYRQPLQFPGMCLLPITSIRSLARHLKDFLWLFIVNAINAAFKLRGFVYINLSLVHTPHPTDL